MLKFFYLFFRIFNFSKKWILKLKASQIKSLISFTLLNHNYEERKKKCSQHYTNSS